MCTVLPCVSQWHLHLCRETVTALVWARRILIWQCLKLREWRYSVEKPDNSMLKYTSQLYALLIFPFPSGENLLLKMLTYDWNDGGIAFDLKTVHVNCVTVKTLQPQQDLTREPSKALVPAPLGVASLAVLLLSCFDSARSSVWALLCGTKPGTFSSSRNVKAEQPEKQL